MPGAPLDAPNQARSKALAMAWKPASLGCRWSRRVVGGQEAGRVGGVAGGGVEVDDPVTAVAGGADPRVVSGAAVLAVLAPVVRALERGRGRADELDAAAGGGG